MNEQINHTSFFLMEYIISLKERSRFEKTGFKNGLDWLIYELGIQKGWFPVRVSFSIDENGHLRSKSEGELGIDTSFLSTDKKELYIFVLKDEKLNNQNWTNAGFDTDIRKAASPNMQQEGFGKVEVIKIVTAYNKDEDRNGIELYTNLTNGFSEEFGKENQYQRLFERWNINTIVGEISNHLLSPELLPSHLTSQFRYICSQINDFDYCSQQWLEQLEPNWKNFINAVLGRRVNENNINLLILSLYILKDSWKSERESYVGWLDLVEWAMLALWQHYYELGDSNKEVKLKAQIFSVWARVYLVELELYFNLVDPVLRTQHGLSLGNLSYGHDLIPINDSFRAYWHMGRLGLLNLGAQDINLGEAYRKIIEERVNNISELLLYMLQANPATSRPLIDLHHIELFLVWSILYQAGKQQDIYVWLIELEKYLTIRRFSNAVNLPFIQADNNLEALVDHVVRGEGQTVSESSSSYLILMLIELCFSLGDCKKRDDLVQLYVERLTKGFDSDGEPYKIKNEDDKQRVDLLSWSPPEDWEEKLIKGSIAMEGIAVTTGNFDRFDESSQTPLSERIELFVKSMREKFPHDPPKILPYSVCILACIKYQSPLPPEFWRATIFPQKIS